MAGKPVSWPLRLRLVSIIVTAVMVGFALLPRIAPLDYFLLLLALPLWIGSGVANWRRNVGDQRRTPSKGGLPTVRDKVGFLLVEVVIFVALAAVGAGAFVLSALLALGHL